MRLSFNPIINGLWLLPWKTPYTVPRSTHIFLTKVGFMIITVGLSHILGKHYIWGSFATDLAMKYYKIWRLTLFFRPRHVLVTFCSLKTCPKFWIEVVFIPRHVLVTIVFASKHAQVCFLCIGFPMIHLTCKFMGWVFLFYLKKG